MSGASATLSPLMDWRGWLVDPEHGAQARPESPVKSSTMRHVGLTLSTHMSSRGDSCFPSLETLAAESDLSKSTVVLALKELAETGWIVRKIGGGKANPTRYTATVPETVRPPDSSDGLTVRPATSNSPATGLEDVNRTEERLEANASSVQLALVGPPKLTKIDGQDIAYNALAQVCGVDTNGNRGSQIGMALNGSKAKGLPHGIREMFWRQLVDSGRTTSEPPLQEGDFERMLEAAIRFGAQRYKQALPGATLTPLALAKWWTDLKNVPPPKQALRYGRGVTTAAIFAKAEELRARGE